MGNVFVSTTRSRRSRKSRNQRSLAPSKCLHIVTTESSTINTIIHSLVDLKK